MVWALVRIENLKNTLGERALLLWKAAKPAQRSENGKDPRSYRAVKTTPGHARYRPYGVMDFQLFFFRTFYPAIFPEALVVSDISGWSYTGLDERRRYE